MFTARMLILNLFVYLTILLSYVGYVFASPCYRVPQGTGAGKSEATGNFRIRISGDPDKYRPGRQYTVFIDRTANTFSSRESGKPKFSGFFLAVEQKSTIPSELAEDFSPAKHGTFTFDENFRKIAKLICGNVATHSSDIPKDEIQVIWMAPESGSGCVTFRATIVENRDVWYMDSPKLTKEFCEDEEAQQDFISNVLEECCACNEAKYELSFEGLWSKHTHPKNFPQNVYMTRFGDIIGASHKIGNGFWTNGELASDGLKELADHQSTQILEAELKNKSDSIRTIIKARGLAYPNITGKTFAVFRVDSENHLVSFVSLIQPSPDWFVGVSALELCTSDCTWVESKVLDLYPWDAGTNSRMTYEKYEGQIYDQSARQEYIRRITSESPANKESPFYSETGSKMKPLARLTLTRQRLYEKTCTAEQSASDDCQVGEYGSWGECTGGACGGNGKQYRQRYYKNPDKATKCHRKLFETKTCIMPRCTHEYEESAYNDPECDEAHAYTDWGPCSPNCKKSEYEMGERTRQLTFKTHKAFKECMHRKNRPIKLTEKCNITTLCIGKNQDEDENEASQPSDDNPELTVPFLVNCEGTYEKYFKYGECVGTCGMGERNRTKTSRNRNCEPIVETEKCRMQQECENADFCEDILDREKCDKDENPKNFIYYDKTTCTCVVFSTYCKKAEEQNIFETFDECRAVCQIDEFNIKCPAAKKFG